MRKERIIEYSVVTLFITAMAIANLVISHFGPAAMPFVAFAAVGVVLVTRDYLHDVWQLTGNALWPRMVVMIAVAGVLAYAVDQSSGRIALASVAALVGSSLAETAAFQRVFRHTWLVRSNSSNVVGAIADSLIFPVVAFGFGLEALGWYMLAQASMKMAGGAFWSLVFRYTLNPDARREARRERLGLAPDGKGTPATMGG